MSIDLNYMVGGEAGQGVQSVGLLLGKVFARGGYHVFADQDYESRVRGGHNFFRVRVQDSAVGAIADRLDVLVALNRETVELHNREISPKGVGIFDSEKVQVSPDHARMFGVPLEKLAVEKAGDKIMTNTVALGAALAVVGYGLDLLGAVLAQHFGAGNVADGNMAAARSGYEYVREHYRGDLPQLGTLGQARLFLTGNEAISFAAVAAGCKFLSAYPMTPASSIMEYFAAKSKEFDLAMVHAEDEIAAVNMAIGASYAGVRAMTATSGSGLCLMVEGLGMSGITETPLVIVDAQRPGPAVGLPTRTEQGDLQFVLTAHQGDFPRVVLAPATVEDCFWGTVNAFNLAEKYQVPVILLTDQHLASSYATVDGIDLSKVTIERGPLYSDKDGDSPGYLRHRVTESGVSPRAFPGLGRALVVTDSDEHDEGGHLIEDAATRKAQMDKRLRKVVGLKREIIPPWRHGPQNPDVLLIGWGSTYGALREAVDRLNVAEPTALLQLNELWPFPSEAVARAIASAKTSYVVEGNAVGQLARLIRAETGRDVSGRILKYDGRPFTPAGIVEALKKERE